MSGLSVAQWEALEAIIIRVRDASPRQPNDAETAEIVDEIEPLIAGWLAEAKAEGRREAEVAALTTVTDPWSPDRIGRGICPKCREDKFIGHGPLCWECFAGSRKEAGA